MSSAPWNLLVTSSVISSWQALSYYVRLFSFFKPQCITFFCIGKRAVLKVQCVISELLPKPNRIAKTITFHTSFKHCHHPLFRQPGDPTPNLHCWFEPVSLCQCSNRSFPLMAQKLHTWPKAFWCMFEYQQIIPNKICLFVFVTEPCMWSSDMVCIRGV